MLWTGLDQDQLQQGDHRRVPPCPLIAVKVGAVLADEHGGHHVAPVAGRHGRVGGGGVGAGHLETDHARSGGLVAGVNQALGVGPLARVQALPLAGVGVEDVEDAVGAADELEPGHDVFSFHGAEAIPVQALTVRGCWRIVPDSDRRAKTCQFSCQLAAVSSKKP